MLAFLLLLHLFFPNTVSAQVINEVFPNPSGDENTDEWVEIYNPEDSEIDLTGYLLEDKAGHQLLIDEILVESTIIGPKGFLVLTRNGSELSLNNSDNETIYLYNNIDKSETLDTFSYNDSDTDRSWGRIPDGSTISVSSLDPSPGGVNIPPPTPTPTNTPTPTKTPKPTNTPKPSPTPTIKTTPTTKVTQTLSEEGDQNNKDSWEGDSENKILGIRKEFEHSKNDEPDTEDNQDKKQFPVIALAFILGGMSFVGAGTYPYLKRWFNERNKSKKNIRQDEKINL